MHSARSKSSSSLYKFSSAAPPLFSAARVLGHKLCSTWGYSLSQVCSNGSTSPASPPPISQANSYHSLTYKPRVSLLDQQPSPHHVAAIAYVKHILGRHHRIIQSIPKRSRILCEISIVLENSFY